MHPRASWLVALFAVPFGFVLDGASSAAHAKPPPWAPAHGYREKHHDDDRDERHEGHDRDHDRDRVWTGYSGRDYDDDYGIAAGRCNREAVGAVIGGVAGGVIANRVSNRDDRVVATILGAAVGALVGSRIGKNMDERDRACMGHALELGTTGRGVEWRGDGGRRYEMVPRDGRRIDARVCRDFDLRVYDEAGRRTTRRGTACQSRPGVWETR